VSSPRRADQQPPAAPPEPAPDSLGYLLKHAYLRYSEVSSQALAPYAVNGRLIAVLRTLAAHDPAPQGEVAKRMGVDRTTMVMLIDELQDKGLVQRHQDPQDRRRNVLVLTDTGAEVLRRSLETMQATERWVLRELSPDEARALRKALQVLVHVAEAPPAAG
jgi:DNA-binding MarR family transcriptional regulator